jgi:hypothetical protein
MNTETDYLKSIAEEIAANYSGNDSKPNHHLEVEAKRLEKAISHSLSAIENFTQRDTFHFNTLNKLVNICDILFDITGTVNPDVMVLIELLTSIKQVIPNEIRPNLKLPKAFVVMQKESLTESWLHYSKVMQEQEIGNELVDIAGIPFKRFIEAKHKLFWGDFTWLKGYQAKLDMMDWENADCNSKSEALLSLLIGIDFNDDRFYIYCKKYVQARTKAIAGKRNRLLEYAQCEKLVLEDTQVEMPSYDVRANSVSARLIKWIREEIDFVETHECDQLVSKFEFNWNVETIAFFFKLLWDRNVFAKGILKDFAQQIAANCSSTGKDEFEASTINSRFYIKEPETLRPLEKLLTDMLEDVRRYLR